MQRKKIVTLLIVAFLHASLGLLSGALGWPNQSFVVIVAGFATIWFTYAKIDNRILWMALSISPFYLIYIPASIVLKSTQTFPIWIIGCLSCIIAMVLLSKKTRYGLMITGSIVIANAAVTRIWFMPNYLTEIAAESRLNRFTLKNISITDSMNNKINFDSINQKIVILDVWHTACKPCIDKFPDLEKLKNQYAADSSILIYSLNIPLNVARDRKRAEELTNKYTFRKIYFSSKGESEKLSISAVPQFFVFDKAKKCVFSGELNLNEKIYYNNIHKIIRKIKNS